MHNFKIGQRVICIQSFKGIYHDIIEGQDYTVTSILPEDTSIINIDNQSDGGDLVWWCRASKYFKPLDKSFAEELEANIAKQVKEEELVNI